MFSFYRLHTASSGIVHLAVNNMFALYNVLCIIFKTFYDIVFVCIHVYTASHLVAEFESSPTSFYCSTFLTEIPALSRLESCGEVVFPVSWGINERLHGTYIVIFKST